MLTKSSKVDNQTVVETEWRTWTRFEGQCIQGIPTFFTGGPVWAISWLPIPTLLGLQEDVSEFLAISTHLSMDKEYLIKQTYSGKNIIQIWDVKNLRSKNLRNPELAYAIVHEGGTIWCLEWCPSGCYELASLLSERSVADGPKRMGLLAGACSDGCVRIYSLVFPKHLVKSNTKDPNDVQNTENKYPLYDTKPVLVLIVHRQMYIDNKQTWHVTKISWTKEKGHNIIAGGFSNGYVGLWDLSLKSPLSKFEKDDITFLMPFRHFFAHQQVVTMVYLIPVGDKRFLATAGMDRYYKFWDLEDVSNPKNYIKKSFITDGSWLDNWFCAFITGDDALKLNRNFVYCLPIRDYTYKYYDVLPMNSTSYSISANNFGNSVASGTLAGEVVAMFPHQLINLENMRKILHQKRHTSIFSSIDVVDFQENEQSSGQQQVNGDETTNSKTKNKIYTYMPSTYVESEKRFGLTFRDKVGVSTNI
ncbi:general transcription factor 3C polypeptide 2-like [Copidosoma floridanum]|uniref:general transcription factor 3C polypeptide 2-like n=1 Tax=Copidosoma floridanum TaxID=29053 RepID=UPI0006C9A651|nr:general transcription factor 3C polypeptide 2-like [Copidosoma floridanum]